MKYTIFTIESENAIVGWRVIFDDMVQTVVFASDLPVPGYPTKHQIIHVARVQLAPPVPPKPLRRSRVKRSVWTTAHEKCAPVAVRFDVDIDEMVKALPDALECLIGEWNSRELAKRQSHEITGLTVRDVERIDNRNQDHSRIPHFDEHAQEIAWSCPELNWTPSDDCSLALWELLHEPLRRKPTKYAPETIERAAEFVTRRQRGEIVFSEWSDDESLAEHGAEFVPF